MRTTFGIVFILFSGLTLIWAQQSAAGEEAKRKINIIYGGNFTKDNAKYPGASIFSRDDERQVQFEHQGADMWCDVAVLFSEQNRIEAYGNIRLQQGDSIEMNSKKLIYNGNTRMADAYEDVYLTNG
jgi:lipopolysaccharide assembly outer membrane protein LptD (OstA)